MTLSLNNPKLDNPAGDIWKSAERLRGKFKAYEYQSVILPIIVIRRLCAPSVCAVRQAS
jgi:type I restriction enzyme M protein